MEKEEVLSVFQDIVSDLEIVGSNELDRDLWHYYGNGLWSKLVDNKLLLVEFLESEFHSNHRLSPCVSILRDCLWKVIKALPFPWELDNTVVYDAFADLSDKCKEWLKWINQYFPAEQSKKVSVEEVTIMPKRISAAAKKLATPELQAVKRKLVDAGLIVDGKWTGTAAEFGFLVTELSYTHYVINGERKAWNECAEWVGFDASRKESARKAIDQNPDMSTPNTDIIRDACKK